VRDKREVSLCRKRLFSPFLLFSVRPASKIKFAVLSLFLLRGFLGLLCSFLMKNNIDSKPAVTKYLWSKWSRLVLECTIHCFGYHPHSTSTRKSLNDMRDFCCKEISRYLELTLLAMKAQLGDQVSPHKYHSKSLMIILQIPAPSSERYIAGMS
jgi:hypothetical protein